MGTYKNVLPVDSDLYVKPTIATTELRVISSTGQLYNNGVVPINYLETITYSSVGLSVSTATAYGVTFVDAVGGGFSSSPAVLAVARPIIGVSKTFVFDTTAAAINTLDLNLAGATISGTSGDYYIAFSSLATATQSLTLVGLTTAIWAVSGILSTIAYGAADGIRSSTAARTS